jgi:hypothetical protein
MNSRATSKPRFGEPFKPLLCLALAAVVMLMAVLYLWLLASRLIVR